MRDDNIHRAIVIYSNGVRVWANRSCADWEVEGYTLPPKGYLVIGPNGFRQYRARVEDKIVEVVQSRDYQYFFCEKPHDLGPLVFGGAFAVREKSPGRVIVYQILSPRPAACRCGWGRPLGRTPGRRWRASGRC